MKTFITILLLALFLVIACDEAPENQVMQYNNSAYERELEKGAKEIRDKFIDKNSVEYAIRFPKEYKEYQKRCGLKQVEPCCK
jgi:hypothetical protein